MVWGGFLLSYRLGRLYELELSGEKGFEEAKSFFKTGHRKYLPYEDV
jgi:hypothetical protein